MLHEFVAAHRHELIARCKEKVQKRFAPTGSPSLVDHGVPLFLEQLGEILRCEQLTTIRSDAVIAAPAPTDIGRAAALHGAELMRRGYSIDQVVHDYGDICQAITEMAVEQEKSINADEFRTLNRCLDNAIADAVTSFGKGRQDALSSDAEALRTQLDTFSVEQRRLLDTSIEAFTALRTGNIGLNGATAAVLLHSLLELRALVDWWTSEIRLTSAMTTLTAPPAPIELP